MGRLHHLDHDRDDGFGGVEFPAALALGRGEFTDEVFVDAPDQVEIGFGAVQFEVGEHLDQAGDDGTVEVGPAKDFGQRVLQRGVRFLDLAHGIVHLHADIVCLGIGGEPVPAGLCGHPEDVFGLVFFGVFKVDIFILGEFGALGFERGRDIAEEEKAQGNVFVFARVHRPAHLVSSGEEGLFNAFCHSKFFLLGMKLGRQLDIKRSNLRLVKCSVRTKAEMMTNAWLRLGILGCMLQKSM